MVAKQRIHSRLRNEYLAMKLCLYKQPLGLRNDLSHGLTIKRRGKSRSLMRSQCSSSVISVAESMSRITLPSSPKSLVYADAVSQDSTPAFNLQSSLGAAVQAHSVRIPPFPGAHSSRSFSIHRPPSPYLATRALAQNYGKEPTSNQCLPL